MWSKLGSQSKSSSAVEVDFLNLCKHNVRIIEDFANSGNLLNQRQCQDLSSKLLKTTQNIRELVLVCGASAVYFRPALESLYRYLEKAKALVSKCGEEDWCTAAVFQSQNENAFREILLEVGLCYNAFYEQAKSTSEDSNVLLEDLRQCSVFCPATATDVLLDHQDLQRRLEELANKPSSSKLWDLFLPGGEALKKCLARYLLLKLVYTSEQSQVTTLDTSSAIFWAKETEPSGAWGKSSCFLGAGAGSSGVCSTKWMGIPCAKKEFHPQDAAVFFLKEAGILAYLKHPCVVNFFCCGNGQERGDRFIVMELMEKSLASLIEDQKGANFALSVLVDMIVQIARGMCYLHDQGVAHRDLKPQNVVVNRLTSSYLVDHFSAKLVDFGMSKTKVEVSKFNTMSGAGIGTTRYKAPEVYPQAHPDGKGKTTWFKADVFSFAITCSHILTLKIPFEGTNVTELYNGLINGQRPNLPEDCPNELAVLLRDCWDINPRSRPSFIEICTRLELFQYKILRGFSMVDQGVQKEDTTLNAGFEFIKAMVEEQSNIQKTFTHAIHDEVEDETYNLNDIQTKDRVPTIPCICTRSLEFLPQSVYEDEFLCNMCWRYCEGEVYHCETCEFDADPDCAKITDEVNVFFHADPLHLLVQNYYDNNPDPICGFCKEPLQGSKWVYRCKQCNFGVHAFCTKHPKKVDYYGIHSHPLTLVQSPHHKNASCKWCNGNFEGYYYTCTQKWCTFELHALCVNLPLAPSCILDSSHRLSLEVDNDPSGFLNPRDSVNPRGFQCARCGALGFSHLYHCKVCDVDIHLDCMNGKEEEEDDGTKAYQKFMLEYGNKADHSKVDMISEVLDLLLISSGLETSSSSSSQPPPVIMRVPTSREVQNSNAFDDVNVCKKSAAETSERKAKKMAAKHARQKARSKLMAEQGVKLESLGKILQDLQSSKVDAEVFAATHEKLRKLQDYVQEVITSKMRQVPRIGLFYSEDANVEMNCGPTKLFTSLPGRIWGVCLVLLCEEPGHEHIVRLQGRSAVSGYNIQHMVREQLEELQPLLASGLQVVRTALSRATHITKLDAVTLPTLSEQTWDLTDIDLEKHNKTASCEDEENVELLKMAEETAAEALLSCLEDNDISILDSFGLRRVCYTMTEQGDCPRYRRGTVAWLCTEHQNRGLEADILTTYPLRIYHNLEYDRQRQFL